MATAELGLLGILRGKLVSDAVEQLDVALLWVLLQGVDERPRHGTSSLCRDGCIGPMRKPLVSATQSRLYETA
jgi:hypothetical protein